MFTGPSPFPERLGMQRSRYESTDWESLVEYRRAFLYILSYYTLRRVLLLV